MAHKEAMFNKGKKSRRMKHLIQDYESGSRRATLASFDDVERMAVESSRAQYIRELKAGPKEFGSSYRGTSNYYGAPCSITSHTERKPKLVKIPITTTFPSLVGEIRFSDDPEDTTTTSQTDISQERKFTCKCENCSRPRCPGRLLTEKKTDFKDNIMKFCDQSTMTPKLVNADCGYSPSSVRVECGVSPFTIRDVAVRDTDGRCSTPERRCRSPTPILRRCSPPVENSCSQRRLRCESVFDNAVNECHTECSGHRMRPLQSLKRFFLIPKDCSVDCPNADSTTRYKNLYNEGISDSIANRVPATSADRDRVLPPPEPIPDCSRACVTSKCPNYMCGLDNYIPFSHKHNSRYHYDCKRAKEPERVVKDKQVKDSCSRLVRQVCARKPVAPCRVPYIRLPRKVLASENNVEGFVTKNQCNKCRKR